MTAEGILLVLVLRLIPFLKYNLDVQRAYISNIGIVFLSIRKWNNMPGLRKKYRFCDNKLHHCCVLRSSGGVTHPLSPPAQTNH